MTLENKLPKILFNSKRKLWEVASFLKYEKMRFTNIDAANNYVKMLKNKLEEFPGNSFLPKSGDAPAAE